MRGTTKRAFDQVYRRRAWGPWNFPTDVDPIPFEYRESGAVGRLIKTLDTLNKGLISGGKLCLDSSGTGGDPRFVSQEGFPRIPGMAIYGKLSFADTNATRTGLGFSGNNSSSSIHTINASTTLNFLAGNPTTGVLGTFAAATEYEVLIVVRPKGCLIYVRGGAFVGWNLFYVQDTGADNPIYPTIRSATSLAVGVGTRSTVDAVELKYLGRPFDSQMGSATDYKEVSAALDTITMTAAALVSEYLTYQTGVTKDIMFRRTDDSNCWILRMDGSANFVRLISKTAGVETVVSSVAQTWVNGTEYRLWALISGTNLRTYVDVIAKSNVTNATQPSGTTAKTTHAGRNFEAWPRVQVIAELP